MEIALGRVDISINEFQKISNGKFNAKDATNETRFAAIQKFADDLGARL